MGGNIFFPVSDFAVLHLPSTNSLEYQEALSNTPGSWYETFHGFQWSLGKYSMIQYKLNHRQSVFRFHFMAISRIKKLKKTPLCSVRYISRHRA